MATDWTVPTRADLYKVLSVLVADQANQNTAWGTKASDPYDKDAADRMGDQLAMAVAELRGTIKAVRRFPLSVTAGAVPPSSVPHVLHLAAWRLLMSTPGVPMVVIGEQAAARRFYDDAVKFLDKIRAGGAVETPSDPTGVDYLTEVSAENPAICWTRWSDLYASDAEYTAGYVTNSDGSLTTLPVDDMRIL